MPGHVDKSGEESFDVLTVFIIIMGICSLVIGVWGLVAYSKLGPKEARVEAERDDLYLMISEIKNRSNRKFFGSFTSKKRDVTPNGTEKSDSFSMYLTSMAVKTKIDDRVTGYNPMRDTRVSAVEREYTIEASLAGVTAGDIATFIRNVETFSAEVRAKYISLTRFKKTDDEKDYLCRARITFNLFTRVKPKVRPKGPRG